MIGVIAKQNEMKIIKEFFELFKTPWEYYQDHHCYDTVLTTTPTWLSEWTNTGEIINGTDTPRRLYSKAFPVGSNVNLGGNFGITESSMYTVIVKFDNPDANQPDNSSGGDSGAGGDSGSSSNSPNNGNNSDSGGGGNSGGGFDRIRFKFPDKPPVELHEDDIETSIELNRRNDGRPRIRIDVPWYGGGMSFGSVSNTTQLAKARAPGGVDFGQAGGRFGRTNPRPGRTASLTRAPGARKHRAALHFWEPRSPYGAGRSDGAPRRVCPSARGARCVTA